MNGEASIVVKLLVVAGASVVAGIIVFADYIYRYRKDLL